MRHISRSLLLVLAGSCLPVMSSGCSHHESPSARTADASTDVSSHQKYEQILQLSPRVAEQLRLMRERGKLKPSAIVRITVAEGNFHRFKNGGDKRYRYTLLLDDDPKNVDDDYVMESQGLTVHVAKQNAEFLRGAEVIWIESGGRGGFKFLNPNEVEDDAAAAQVIENPGSTETSDSREPATASPTLRE